MKYTGIWIDKRNAKIITIENGNAKMNSIHSEIEEFKIHGGSGSRQKGGPQDVVQDSKFLKREKNQTKRYFEDIIPAIKDTDSLVIFGPAQTGNDFNKELSKKHPNIYKKVKSVEKTDTMTDNQLVAWVKDFFKQ
ncbi:MAG TPA: hypothetical protein EYG92_02000 [Lutibacter sp.]|nr:hypothetical protein [Lutibacter sp.]